MVAEKQEQDLEVQISRDFEGMDVDVQRLAKVVETVCGRFGVLEGTVSIGIVGDEEICRISERFLKRDAKTDCLSFDLSDGEPEGSKYFDLVVNGEKALREARHRNHSSEAELALYITHGLLHQFGFDDSACEGAEKMHETEDEILQQLGYGCVYDS